MDFRSNIFPVVYDYNNWSINTMSSAGGPSKRSALIISQARNNSMKLPLDNSTKPNSPLGNDNQESSFRLHRILERKGGDIFSSPVSHLITTSIPSVSVNSTQPISLHSTNQILKQSKPLSFFSDSTVSPEPPSSAPYLSRLDRLLLARPNRRWNYLMNISGIFDNFINQRKSRVFFAETGTLTSILKKYNSELYYECDEDSILYSFCQYRWIVAWDSTSKKFYPFTVQKRIDL